MSFIEGFTIKDKIDGLDKDLSSISEKTEGNMIKYLNFENIVVEKIQELKKENDVLRKEIQELKKIITSKNL